MKVSAAYKFNEDVQFMEWLIKKTYNLQSKTINPFLANSSMSCLLKKPKNLWFFGVFREYKMGSLARNGLK